MWSAAPSGHRETSGWRLAGSIWGDHAEDREGLCLFRGEGLGQEFGTPPLSEVPQVLGVRFSSLWVGLLFLELGLPGSSHPPQSQDDGFVLFWQQLDGAAGLSPSYADGYLLGLGAPGRKAPSLPPQCALVRPYCGLAVSSAATSLPTPGILLVSPQESAS